jgi:hypothetical protein
MDEQLFATLRTWVGRSYAELKCWDVIVAANKLRGVEIPADYATALERRMFKTVVDPEPWDVVPICDFATPIVAVTHVGLVLDHDDYIQSVENAGLVLTQLFRPLRFGRFATVDGSPAFLRLRSQFL